jgi:hypothetical protein
MTSSKPVFRNRCAANSHEKIVYSHVIVRKSNILSLAVIIRNTYTHTHTVSSSIVLLNMCCVLFSYACILRGQVFICRYIFMAMYSFDPPVTVAVRSEAWVLAGWLLGSWVRIPLKAWMFVPCLSVCPV